MSPQHDQMAAEPESQADVRVLRNAARMRREGPEPEPLGETSGRHRAMPAESAPAAWSPPARGFDPPGTAQAPPAAPPQPPAGAEAPVTHAGLPRRVRQENLAPQLRGERAAQQVADGEEARSPEQAGALIASMQAGWRRARAEASDTMRSADGEGSK
jgi:hypothetical protein